MRPASESCKENNAALCKYNCAAAQLVATYVSADCRDNYSTIWPNYRINTVDNSICVGVIIFTHILVLSPGHTYAETSDRRSQTGNPAPAGNAQPTPRRCYRRVIPSQRVLRCAGCGSGQVRDAAARRERGPSDHGSGRGV